MLLLIKLKRDFRIYILIIGALVATFSWFAIEQVKTLMVNKYIANEAEKELLLTQDSAKILELQFKNLEEKLNLIVYTTQIQNNKNTVDNCEKELTDILSLFHNRLNALIRIDINKRVTCSTTGFTPNSDVSTNPNVINTFETKKLTLGRAIYGPASGRYVISLVAPIYKNGVFDGALSGTIFLDKFRDSYLAGYGIYGHGNMLVIDDNGDIINHYVTDLIGKNRFTDEVKNNKETRPYVPDIINLAAAGKTGISVEQFNGKKEHVSFATANIFPERKWVLMSISRNQDIASRTEKYFTYKGYGVYAIYHTLSLTLITLVTSIYLALYTYKKREEFE